MARGCFAALSMTRPDQITKYVILTNCHHIANYPICTVDKTPSSMFYQQLQHRRRSFVNGTNRIVGDMVTICQDDIFCNLIGTCHAERSEASEVTPSGWHADAERS